MIQEQARPTVNIAIIFEKNKSRKKREKKKRLYEIFAQKKKTLLAELQLEKQYNYKILL